MIERQVIGGRNATVTYIKGDWTSGTKDDYDFAKVFFEDGEVVFLQRPPQEPADAHVAGQGIDPSAAEPGLTSEE